MHCRSFANEGNYQEAADYLNQELSYDKLALSGAHRANSLGAPLADTPHSSRHIGNPVLANFAPVNFDFPTKADKVHCINVIHALFLEVQKSKAGQEEVHYAYFCYTSSLHQRHPRAFLGSPKE